MIRAFSADRPSFRVPGALPQAGDELRLWRTEGALAESFSFPSSGLVARLSPMRAVVWNLWHLLLRPIEPGRHVVSEGGPALVWGRCS
jgi:hypothetical protein